MNEGNALKRSTILIYGSVAMPLALIGYPLAVYLPPFYAQELGINMAVIGLVLMIARFTDVITDLLIGALSDRWQTRFGRRKLWLLAGTPLMIIAAFQVFMPAKSAGAGYLFIWTSILYLGWTMVMIPHNAWGAELSDAYHERSRVTAGREAYILIGLLLAGLIPAFVQAMGKRFQEGQTDGVLMQFLVWSLGENGILNTGLPPILRAIAWIMALLLPLVVILAVLKVKEPPPRSTRRIEWKKGLTIIRKNSVFRRMMLMLALLIMAESFRSALSVFFMQYVMNIQATIGLMYLIYFGAGILGIPFWLFLGKRIGKHRALCVAALISSFGIASMFFLNAGQLIPFTVLFAIKGFCFGSYQLLLLSMLADIVDLDIARSGEQRTGLFFALSGMATKMSMAAGVGLSLGLLAFTGFQVSDLTHTSQQITALRFLYIIGPLLLYLAVFAVAWKYPLTAERQEHLRQKLAQRNLPA